MPQSLLAFGNLGTAERLTLSMVAAKAGLSLQLTQDREQAWASLAAHPRAVVVDNANDTAERLCVDLRTNSETAHVPVIALARELDDLCFAEVFNWGGDDVISLSSPKPLQERLRHLPRETPAPASNRGGIAVVADADPKRRAMLARVLAPAGFSVQFAASSEDLMQSTRDPQLKLVVQDRELHPNPGQAMEQARKHSPDVIWIVECSPRQLLEQRQQLEGLSGCAAIDSFSAPENVVYLANELLHGNLTELRSSPRMLYGTRVAFRGAGHERDDHGYSYNISEGGFYVRTLAPPDDKLLWLELRPPRSDALIRLEAEVVWRRAFGPARGATTPPGFGVRITDGTRADLERWRYGCAAFGEMLGFPSLPPV